MRRATAILSCAVVILFSAAASAQDKPIVLVENGKSGWHIVPFDHGPSLEAAHFIQDCIDSLTGVNIPITTSLRGKTIFIGTGDTLANATDAWMSVFDHDEWFAEPAYGDIYIGGPSPDAIGRAARRFVQEMNGTDMLGPGTYTYGHQKHLEVFRDPYETWSEPAFDFRMIYYHPATDPDYADWHRVRQVVKTRDSEDPDWGLWVHTMHRFIPPAQFEKHPELFAERNGVHVPDQLCLSNAEVLRITVDSLRAMMARKPYARYWSVSQMDNFNHCQCAQCHRTDSIECSPSGTILRFANAVADSFPNKVISTLAYQYSRKAPKVTKPRPNVNIMLCSIEEDRSKPIASRDEPGSFTADLREWSSLTRNIIVWDYVINFSHLLAPFPNWKVLQPNLQLFRDAGVPMVFEQGLSSPGGEMPEFRCYLLAKLLSNPDLNIDSLRWHFMDSYYGEAGVYIDKYTRLLEEELDKSGHALTLYEHPQAHKDGYLSPENLAKYKMLFNSAEAAVMDEDLLYQQRVEAARLPIMYAELEIAQAMPGTEHGLFEKNATGEWEAKPYFVELLDTLVIRAKRHGNLLFHETRLPPDEYHEQMRAHLTHGAQNHLAVGKTITFIDPPDPKYTGGSSHALIDGFSASTNYQFGWQGWWGEDMVATIDLGRSQSVGHIEFAFLRDQQSWIFLPDYVVTETSRDGVTWTPFNATVIPSPRKETTPTPFGVVATVEPRVKARYIRVTAKNLGPLPAWHGSKGQCWLFCDEVVVR